MLVQFSVKNFLSLDEEQVFSMVATQGDQHPRHLAPDVPGKGEAVLRGAALYGANGAGKSNLVQAVGFARNLIINGTRSGQTTGVKPFKLGQASGRPSKFEFIFKTQGVLYNYGFRLDAFRVWEEWLYATPRTQEVKYFERMTDMKGETVAEFGPGLAGRTKRQKQFLEFVAQGTHPNQLFLTEATERNVAEVVPVMQWFQSSLHILSAEARTPNLETNFSANEALTKFLEAVVRNTGTGIGDINTKESPYDLAELPQVYTEEMREQIQANLEIYQSVVLEPCEPQQERIILKRGEDGRIVRVVFKMQHQGKNGHSVEFSMDEESDGTQRLINLAPAFFRLAQVPGQALVVDELDRRLHTHLSRFLMQAALDCDEEHRQSQLIFTTHDTNLLDLDLLRRDEIWFVEKDKGGASHLYSLVEYKIRPDLKIEKGYLSGRFGAIPFLGDIRCLGLTAESDAPAKVAAAA